MVLKKRFYGKWILSGEHAVLRSKPALAFPLTDYFIDFSYEESDKPLNIKYNDNHSSFLSFLPLFSQALKKIGKNSDDLKGVITIDSCIPFGAGLGASAILSVACAICFEYKKWIVKEEIFTVAKQLEDIFHKKSSGLDVAIVLEQKPLLFQEGKVQKYLNPFKVKPFLYLSYCGKKSSTFFAISKVNDAFLKNKKELQKIDDTMALSVEQCLKAIESSDEASMQEHLQKGLQLGEQSFEAYGLVSSSLKTHIQKLKQAGALACKPTGSGLGGYVLSLWNQKPDPSLEVDFIKASV